MKGIVMENNEKNNLNELEQLKAQYETLKQQFDQQEIVNDRLIKTAIQTNIDFFARNRKVAMIIYPILAVLMYIYFEAIGFRAFGISLALLIAICTCVELWLTRNTRQNVVDNSDLLTLSRNMQKLKTGYSIYVVIWLFVCFVFGAAFTFKYVARQGFDGVSFMNVIWVLGFLGLLILVFGIVAYRTFVGHCNNIIRQIDAIEGRPTTNKNMAFWYFLSSLTILIFGGLMLVYQSWKPNVYTRADNDMSTAGTLEFKDMDVDTMVFDNAGKPIISTITFSYRKNGELTPILVQMTPEGGETWCQFTTAAQGHVIGLFLDGVLIQRYHIQNAVCNGHFYLNTDLDWSKTEAEDFCQKLIKN